MKYKFRSYYKFHFTVIGEDGNIYSMDPELANPGDIYRFYIENEGEMTEEDEKFYIDGMTFTKVSESKS